jgi:prolyl-tRNA editing enzyme YbaK/EbsC (Cys-tRNA(Pro) deacylase)
MAHAVADDLCKLERLAAGQLRLPLPQTLAPTVLAGFAMLMQRSLHPLHVRGDRRGKGAGLSGCVRAVLPASERLDLSKLSALYGGTKKTVELATEEDLKRDYPEFELGAVPPLGGTHRDSVVDRRLAERDSLVLEAGSHGESVRMATADLLRIAEAQVTDICEE